MDTQVQQYIAWIDLETSGFDPSYNEITQIGCVIAARDTFKEVDTFEIKVRFDPEKASAESLEIMGYSPERWADAVEPDVARTEFAAFIRKYCTWTRVSKRTNREYQTLEIAGQNIPFDISFLEPFYANSYFPAAMWRGGYLDLMQVIKALEIILNIHFDSYYLESLCHYFEVPYVDGHDALADARMELEVARLAFSLISSGISDANYFV